MFVVIWQPTLSSELSSDSGLQNKLSVVWFFNFQVLSASGKFFTSSLAISRHAIILPQQVTHFNRDN